MDPVGESEMREALYMGKSCFSDPSAKYLAMSNTCLGSAGQIHWRLCTSMSEAAKAATAATAAPPARNTAWACFYGLHHLATCPHVYCVWTVWYCVSVF